MECNLRVPEVGMQNVPHNKSTEFIALTRGDSDGVAGLVNECGGPP